MEVSMINNNRLIDISTRLNTVESRVLQDIHHQDEMLAFGDTSAYLKVGKNALSIISLSLIENPDTSYNSILDFPSGWGRVTRWLSAGFPEADLAVCEIMTEATETILNAPSNVLRVDCTPMGNTPIFLAMATVLLRLLGLAN
jgi:hypothetical protein